MDVAESVYVPRALAYLLAQHTDKVIGVVVFAIGKSLLKVPSAFKHPITPPDERVPRTLERDVRDAFKTLPA